MKEQLKLHMSNFQQFQSLPDLVQSTSTFFPGEAMGTLAPSNLGTWPGHWDSTGIGNSSNAVSMTGQGGGGSKYDRPRGGGGLCPNV